MKRRAYIYELLMTRSDATHIYSVCTPDYRGGKIGTVESKIERDRKVWHCFSFFNEGKAISRSFPSRTKAADVLYMYWRDWNARRTSM
jgi:hypothetical protein